MFSWFIHVTAWVSTLSLFTDEWYFVAQTCHILVIHSLLDGCLSCFYLSAIVINTAMIIWVWAIFWTSVFKSFGCMLRNGISGLCVNSMLNLGRNCHGFHSSCTILQLPSVYKGSSFSTSLPTLVIVWFFSNYSHQTMNKYLIMVCFLFAFAWLVSFWFLTQGLSYVAQVSLEPRLILNMWSSCVCLLKAGINRDVPPRLAHCSLDSNFPNDYD
jgi:hypothetical protein